ncbi:MAG: RDD family protein [Actinomycetota bacterium]|nr:RDD family protein [Actinomycetota bacterium]
MTTPQPLHQDPRADEQVRSGTNGHVESTDTQREPGPAGMQPHPSGPIPVLQPPDQQRRRPIGSPQELAPPPQFGRLPQLAPPPQFGRPPPFVRQQADHQARFSSSINGGQSELETPELETPELETPEQQRVGTPSCGQSNFDVRAAAVPGSLADFGTRAISSLIDYVIPVITLNVLFAIGVATGTVALSPMLTVVGYLGLFAFIGWNSCYLQGTTGQSVGRRGARTKLVEIKTGLPIGFGRAVLRQFCHNLEFFIGYLWPLWDHKRQTFADKIAGTVVIRVDDESEDRTGNSSP